MYRLATLSAVALCVVFVLAGTMGGCSPVTPPAGDIGPGAGT